MDEDFGELTAVGKKRNLERRRRELMHTRFAELESVLSDINSDRLENAARGRRYDKEKMLLEASECIRKQGKALQELEVQLSAARNDVDTMRSEKREQRGDKTYLRSEIQHLRKENGNIRADNIKLWQAYRRDYQAKMLSVNSEIKDLPGTLTTKPISELPSSPSRTEFGGGQFTNLESPGNKLSELLKPNDFLSLKSNVDDLFPDHCLEDEVDMTQGTLLSELVLAMR